MGQQQLLLLVISVIIVGLAVMGAILLFQDNAADRNRDALLSDLLHLTARAHEYYRRPGMFGGGQSSFAGLTNDIQGMRKLVNTPSYPWVNSNGRYRISTAGTTTSVYLNGVGIEPGKTDAYPVAVTIVVYADSFKVLQTGGPSLVN
jgi:hypothetical protein